MGFAVSPSTDFPYPPCPRFFLCVLCGNSLPAVARVNLCGRAEVNATVRCPCRRSSTSSPAMVRLDHLRLDAHPRPPRTDLASHRLARLRHLHRADALAVLPAHSRRKLARNACRTPGRERPVSPASARHNRLSESAWMGRCRQRSRRVPRNSRRVRQAVRASEQTQEEVRFSSKLAAVDLRRHTLH